MRFLLTESWRQFTAGDVGFFYNTDGNTFSTSLTKIGSTDDIDQILLLDGQEVNIDIAS